MHDLSLCVETFLYAHKQFRERILEAPRISNDNLSPEVDISAYKSFEPVENARKVTESRTIILQNEWVRQKIKTLKMKYKRLQKNTGKAGTSMRQDFKGNWMKRNKKKNFLTDTAQYDGNALSILGGGGIIAKKKGNQELLVKSRQKWTLSGQWRDNCSANQSSVKSCTSRSSNVYREAIRKLVNKCW